jgi:hypothetical protein
MGHSVLFVTAAVLFIGACADGTGPPQSGAARVRGATPDAPDATVSVEAALEDAIVRVLPSFSDAQFGSKLRESLDELRIALGTRDASRLGRSLFLARALIDQADQESESADLGAVVLAIDQAEVELNQSTAASERNSPLTGPSQ